MPGVGFGEPLKWIFIALSTQFGVILLLAELFTKTHRLVFLSLCVSPFCGS